MANKKSMSISKLEAEKSALNKRMCVVCFLFVFSVDCRWRRIELHDVNLDLEEKFQQSKMELVKCQSKCDRLKQQRDYAKQKYKDVKSRYVDLETRFKNLERRMQGGNGSRHVSSRSNSSSQVSETSQLQPRR